MKTVYLLLGFIGVFGFPKMGTAQNARVDSLKNQLKGHPRDTAYVNIANKLADIYAKQGQFVSAYRMIRHAQWLSDSLQFEQGAAEAAINLGSFYLYKEKIDSAVTVLSNAQNKYSQSYFNLKIQDLLATAYRYKGKLSQALQLYQEVLQKAKKLDNPSLLIDIEQNMAVVYEGMGEMSSALEHYTNSLHFTEQNADSSKMAVVLNNIGEAYNNLKKNDQAEKYLKESLQVSKAIGARVNEARVYLNLGNVYKDSKRFDEANECYDKALALSKQMGDNVRPVRIYYNRGVMNLDQGNMDLGRSYLMKSLNLSRKMHIQQGVYYNTMVLGKLAVSHNEYRKASIYFEEALQVSQRMKARKLQLDVQQQMYKMYKKRSDYSKALQHLEVVKRLDDSLKTEAKERALAEYHTKLGMRQQERENKLLKAQKKEQEAKIQLQHWLLLAGILIIVLILVLIFIMYRSNRQRKQINKELRSKNEHLELLNAQIEKQKNELKRMNEVKDKLFAILAHDLRGPLSSMHGVISLIKDGDLSLEDIQDIFVQLDLVLNQNINTIENLLAWAKNQMEGIEPDAEKINLNETAQNATLLMKESADQKGVYLENNIDEDISAYADSNMTELIIRNLISNAVKFSDEGDKVTLDARREGEKVLLSVADTGIGMTPDVSREIFKTINKSRRGTRDERGSGLGLSLCKEFTELQGGRIWFKSSPDKGTVFYVEFLATREDYAQVEAV